jgi:cytidylate kinase
VLRGFSHGGPELYIGVADDGVNRDSLQQFTAKVIAEAGKAGGCVIVGRGSQCVLHQEPTALRVLVYAPLQEKLARMKHRHPHERDLPALLHHMDAERRRYAQKYFGRDSTDRHLYHLCLNSTMGLDACAHLIVDAVHLSGTGQRAEKPEVPV